MQKESGAFLVYANVVQEVFNQDHSPEVADVEGLPVAATK
jgi:hypothetical protein